MKKKSSKSEQTQVTMIELVQEIRKLIFTARQIVVKNVNTIQVITNFEIGQRIVEHEQQGSKRAEYGTSLIKALSKKLFKEFGKGFSERNLRNMRLFYLMYRNQKKIIWQTTSAKLSDQMTAPAQLIEKQIVSRKYRDVAFMLSWSHYVFLMGIDDPDERKFYEIEAHEQNWSLRELKRQFNSSLYERLALSRDKKGIKALSEKGQTVEKPSDALKNPYILEFLGIEESTKYSESDLESAIIDKLEHFLLELGKGFLFEARQKRFTFDENHFFVDLVFYNRLLKCYVLIDLKIGELTHQDIGQMQMYVNYFDRHEKTVDENRTIGIILCRKNREAIVEITLPKDTNIHAKEYKLYLPSKGQLKRKLLDWTKAKSKRTKSYASEKSYSKAVKKYLRKTER